MHSLLDRSGWVLFFLSILLTGTSARAQLTGTKTIPGDYATVSLAVTALNASGVGAGGVTFNIAGGYTETISSTISITATGTAVNQIVFQKDPLSVAANPLITAYTGGSSTPASSVQDGIWRIVGSDYVTIRNIDIRDNPFNIVNPATMEYGFALYKASSTNGCQNVRIEGCTITLNRINNAAATNPMTEGSAGIIVMNATATNAIVVLGSGVGGSNSNNKFYGNTIQNCNIGISVIGVTSASPYTNSDTNNDIGGTQAITGNTIINFGGAVGAANASAAIRTLNQYGVNISYNNINNNNGAGVNHPTTLHGIVNGVAPGASASITNNTITIRGAGTTTNITAIENAAGSTAANNTINISNNAIINGTYTTATSGTFFGILNTSSAATLTITNNTLTGNSTGATSGVYSPVRNNGAVTTAININGNQIGNGSFGAVTYTAANSGSQAFINNTAGASTAALSITNNNFQGITYSVNGTGSNNYIINSAATLSQSITGNTFTSLSVATSGNVTFISNNVALSATGSQNINNNSIVTSFAKTVAGGIVTLFTSTATSITGGVSNNNNNNFSNITLTGATVMDGWVNTDAGAATKTIQNNTFSNWTVGTSVCNAMNINLTSTSNSVSGNTISNISGGGNVTGITTAAGNDRISGNTVHTLSTTGTSVVTGILVTGGTNKHVFANKIYNLQLNNTTNTVSGISVTGSTVATANIYNNLIGDLKAPTGNAATDVVRGISVTTTSVNSTINVYYNTVYLNATSSGTNFSTSGVYHTASATATTANLNLRNNIISNTSTPNGTGIVAALRRSAVALNNYATTSNNNLFFAGSPASNRLLYYDGTNLSQTMVAFKAVVTPMEAASVVEDLVSSSKFVSTSGSSGFFLHLDPAKATLAESGAVNITGFNVDFDAQTRQGNVGYSGTGTAPDIGADEIAGTRALALAGTYSVGTGQAYTSLTGSGGLFSEINSLGLSGNMIVNVTSDLTEDGSYALLPWIETGAGNYTITIKPDASTLRTISGNVATGMIRLNGAKRVTFDGSNGTTTNYFLFRNTNTAGTTASAFNLINGASNNTIAYSNVEAYANATNGVILFGTSTGATGNSNNTINNCNINATVGANTGSVGIYSSGTVGKENTSNNITNNNIYNFRDRGIDIPSTGSTAWTISGNSVYNGSATGSINYAAATFLYGIRVTGGSGYTISNNYVGGSAALATGTNASYASSTGLITYNGIQLTTTSATPASSVKGNTIAGITLSCVPTVLGSNVFMGIETNGSGINIGGTLNGEGNTIGSMATNSSIIITTSTTASTFVSNVHAIHCVSSGGQIAGNRAGGIDLQNIGAAPAATNFRGIFINNATAPSLISGNTIGGSVANSIRFLSNAAPASLLSGITINTNVTSPITVTANTIQNMSFQSTAGTGSNIYGIANNATTGSVPTISNNIITALSTTATAGGMVGIYSNSTSTSLTISGNTISNSTTSSATSALFGINPNGAGTPTISITGNTISGNSTAGNLMAIYNLATPTTLNVTGNIFSGNTITTAGSVFYGVYNQGNVSGAININSNSIGTTISPAVTYSVANSNTQIFIYNIGGTATSVLSISNNNFRGIAHTAQATGGYVLISNTFATQSQNISGNIFTNLSINTTGNVTLISNNVSLSATGTQNVNNNSISGTFSKTGAGGSVVGFSNSSASSPSGSVINHDNNNFSGMTVTGATTLTGWLIVDPGASTRTISNNTFNNWTAGTGTVAGISLTLTGNSNSVTGNTMSNMSTAGTLYGVLSSGNENIFLNTIHSLTSSGDNSVIAINVTGGTTKNIYRNKIYNLSKTINGTSAFTVTGIAITTANNSSTINIYNNIIGDLRSTTASSVDAIRGIALLAVATTSAFNVYYNTIYINATSTGTNFGTTAIYHIANATFSTSQLDLRNNILANYSTPAGTGRTVSFRRSAATLANYFTASNNNIYYAGTPGASRLIYFDGTNADQVIGNYKLRVTLRDLGSQTEDVASKFLSLVGSSALFVHVNASASTLIEGGGSNITNYTTDFDGQIRAGNPGYAGSSFNPDIGADEVFGTESVLPLISYALLANTTVTTNVTLSSVNITDASGINVAAGTKPRIYYKRFADANVWLDNTSSTSGWKYTEATNGGSPFSFTINYALLYGGATSLAGPIQYFVVAQDNATVANVAINSGTFAATPASVALTSAAFPIGGTINSYNISFSGTYNVGSSEVYTSLTRADGMFAAINSAGMHGSVTLNITSDLSENGATALGQWTETGAGNYTLAIRPDAGIPRTISGDALNGLIRLDGADRVNIDGRNSGVGPFLKFVNTNALGSSGTAFTFINAATNNTIQYSEVQAYADATRGVILFSTSTAPGGNTNNTIDNCAISATVNGNTGNVAICSIGTSAKDNSTITISNNIISSYRDRAMDLGTASSLWAITGNSFYNGDVSSAINYGASSVLHTLRIQTGSGYSILNNYIGGNGPLATGSASYSSSGGNVSYVGVLLTSNSASPASFVRGNTIAGVALSSVPTAAASRAFTGIETGGLGVTIGGTLAGEGNTIGSTTVNSNISVTTATTSAANTTTVMGINCQSIGGSITGNLIGGIDVTNIGSAPAPSTITGIRITGTSAPSPVSNNTIGGAVVNNIRILQATTALATVVNGIVATSSVTGAVVYDANFIQNITNSSSTSSGTFIGINNTAASTAAATITNNIIQGISGAANVSTSSGVYTGIYSQSTSTISSNTIDNIVLSSTGTQAQVRGIWTSGATTHTISSNTISNLTTASTKTSDVEVASPTEHTITGILSAATTGPQVITVNTLFGFNATSASNINTTVSGISVSASSSGNIHRNRINSFTNNATGTATLPGISGITASNGTFNIYNNAISLTNANNTNRVRIYGMMHTGSASAWTYIYNTVLISGSASGAARSAAFIRNATSQSTLRNNILLNTRTGSGPNYALSNNVTPANTNWTASTSDYNDLYSSGTTTEWGTTPSSFAQWLTLSGGDTHSVNKLVTFIASANDLAPDPLANCSINNSATPISSPISITTDITNAARNATTPDMGAYEFNYAINVASAGNNSPVCTASPVLLTSDAGTAINPTFSWTDPNSNVISTLQNPTVSAVAGTYIVTVTDATGCSVTANTLVSTLARPTAAISGSTTICNGSTATLTLTGTGTGTLAGTLSSGDGFNGAPPSFTFGVSPTTTTIYTLNTLSDDNCAALPQDLSGTVTVSVTGSGQWFGTNSVDWNDALNWCGGTPLPTTNVRIASGTPFSPQVSGTGAVANDLTIDASALLTLITTATLDIKGDFNNNGTFDAGTGTLIFSGSTIQNITSATTTRLQNITVTNTSSPGLRVQSNHNLSGVLTLASNAGIDADGSGNTSVFTLLSSADNPTQDAAIAALPAGAYVQGNVTVQRFMTIEGAGGGGIYRYISSPIQSATVADIQNEIPITGPFTGTSVCPTCTANISMWAYNETIITDSNGGGVINLNDGYIAFPTTSNSQTLATARGYAMFVRGYLLSSARWDVRGTINAANVTPISFPVTFTSSGNIANDGWNLVGNPFPSTIDWNAASGWTKTNMNGSIYTTDNGNGSTQYATWNGVTGTNGGSRYIAIGQGFWVKAIGAPTLQASELVKTAGTQTTFFRTGPPLNLLRITMSNSVSRDEAVIHLRDDATNGFDDDADALKLSNSSFNLSTIDDSGNDLAINSGAPLNCTATIKVKIANAPAGNYKLQFSEHDSFAEDASLVLVDAFTSDRINLRQVSEYTFAVTSNPATTGSNRFSIIISTAPVTSSFTLEAERSCREENITVRIAGSQAGATYKTPFTEEAVTGNGNEVLLQFPKQQLDGNTIQINATKPECDQIATKSVDVDMEEMLPAKLTQSLTGFTSNYDEGNQWYVDGKKINGATTSSFEPQQSGLYHVQVTYGECSVTSDKKEFIVTAVEADSNGELVASPNPARDKLTVFIPSKFGQVIDVKISNLLGQVVGRASVRADGKNSIGEFDLKQLPSGIYLVHVVGEHSVEEIRVVKQ